MTTPIDVLVIGGGVAGMVAARECAQVGLSVTILEATDAVGGPVAGHVLDGLSLDSGAESFAVRGGTVAAFIEDLGLSGQVVAPNVAGAWLHLPALPSRSLRSGADAAVSVPLPRAGVLGVPGSPLADDVRRVIGWSGSLRAYLDRLMPVLTIGREHSLGELVRKRMGARVLDRLVEPVASGVYTTSAVDLEIDVVAPGLNRALTTAGSLSGAVSALRAGAPAGSNVAGLLGGMASLPAALVAALDRHNVTIRTSTTAETLARSGTDDAPTWNVTLSRPGDAQADTLTARYVIIATQGAQALGLVSPLGPQFDALAELDWPAPTAVTLTSLVLDAPALDAHPRGTGVLVAIDAPDVTAKALTHVTAKWAWVAKAAGPGRHVVRLSYGRAGAPNPTDDLSDDELQTLALHDASVLLGVPLPASSLRAFARTEWRDALSPATLGAPERAQQVREAVAQTPALEVTGAWLAGTGLASVIPHALEAGDRIRHAALGLTITAPDR
ncbi:FAD-binding protein [Cryobacterium sp. TMT1-3]|uniref:FAD-binding protein n=1 Tax=Cryobacterium luteum TaxID=1424661 RepID=A0A1H8B1B0_9MICO|nr:MULTISPECIES: FAD-dependent oxidoreductase [Cryobacterium]TFB88704.1 FAD-binding protein [Cryobacterium luteum]TFC24708.1 FAD-binding protein [Cryobacterium sp. TMT1-3]SEM76695.1 oxygen-dependent protoporphyrinogen oxidase [Cryobacterium luteum]